MKQPSHYGKKPRNYDSEVNLDYNLRDLLKNENKEYVYNSIRLTLNTRVYEFTEEEVALIEQEILKEDNVEIANMYFQVLVRKERKDSVRKFAITAPLEVTRYNAVAVLFFTFLENDPSLEETLKEVLRNDPELFVRYTVADLGSFDGGKKITNEFVKECDETLSKLESSAKMDIKNDSSSKVSQKTSSNKGSGGNVLAALCSFFIPGLGQLCQGRLGIALVQFLLAGFLWIFFLGWIIHIWSIVNAATFEAE